MKRYRVRITAKAERDMERIYDYIAETLHSPVTARRQYERIAEGIASLDMFPERCRPIQINRRTLRQLFVDRYSVIYTVEADTVTALRVLYSASDVLSRLKDEL